MLVLYDVGTEQVNLNAPKPQKDVEFCSLCDYDITFSIRAEVKKIHNLKAQK